MCHYVDYSLHTVIYQILPDDADRAAFDRTYAFCFLCLANSFKFTIDLFVFFQMLGSVLHHGNICFVVHYHCFTARTMWAAIDAGEKRGGGTIDIKSQVFYQYIGEGDHNSAHPKIVEFDSYI